MGVVKLVDKKELLKIIKQKLKETKYVYLYDYEIFEILDKYTNEPDYKAMWEELKRKFNALHCGRDSRLMNEIEKKYETSNEEKEKEKL